MRTRSLILALAMVGAVLGVAPGQSGAQEVDPDPQLARGLTVPVGFAARVFAQMDELPTSLSWGASTVGSPSYDATAARAGDLLHGIRLYVTATRNPFSGGGVNPVTDGKVIAFEDEGMPATIVAENLDQPLGVVMGPGHVLYVTENLNFRGRVTALSDTDGDGYFETRRTVIKNLPNGRHQTNGLSYGPDGMLYVANGNATDNGVECGPDLGGGVECAEPERQPWSGSIIRVNPSWTDVDLLTDIRMNDGPGYAPDGMDRESVLASSGYRNIYDVDFDPRRSNMVWTPMNGSDNPSSSEPLYSVDVTNESIIGQEEDGTLIKAPIIEDAGFPMCLYDPHINPFPMPSFGHSHPGMPDPQDNPSPKVQEQFGTCPVDSVHRPEAIFSEGHEGTSGLAFERGGQFPERYRNDLFVAEWGSIWNLNGGTVTGHKLIHVDLDDNRKVVRQREFMTNVLPIDVTFGPNGYMYVADMTGQIYEVRHVTDAATPDVVRVDMIQGQFVPQVVTVARGQTVRWTNLDAACHNVRSVQKVVPRDPPVEEGTAINSPGDCIPQNGSHSYTFWGETAAYHYNSTATGVEANTMRGTIVVLPVER